MKQTIIKYSPPSATFDQCHRFQIDGPDARKVSEWFATQEVGRFEDGQLSGSAEDFAFISLDANEEGELWRLKYLRNTHANVQSLDFHLLK